MKKLIQLFILLFITTNLAAQNAFYKSNFLYAHTFENGLNDGFYRNTATESCMSFVGMTVPSVGGPDPKVPVMQVESTGSINQDDSFDPGGLNARCFPQIGTSEVTPIVYNSGSTIIDNLSLSFLFSADSEPNISGLYFEAGQVNMSGLFETNSNAQYRVVIHEGDLYGPELYTSEILNNTELWNRYYVPFANVNTQSWAGKTITFEIRFWNNNQGHPFFRLDDIALIGHTFCDRGNGRIGNLIWEDSNQDGIVNGVESGIPNVVVELYQDDGDGIFNPDPLNGDALYTTRITDASGNYLFENISDGNFFVVVPNVNFDYNMGLSGYFPTTGVSVNANLNIDNQDHGIVNTSFKLNGIISSVLTLAEGTEPTDDGDDADGNLTMDFGFYTLPTLSLGNLVWEEITEDGLYNSGEGEIGISDVILNLYEDTDGSNDFSTADVLLDQATTNNSGNYFFTGLLDGDYIIVIPVENFDLGNGSLTEYRLSQGIVPTDPDDNINDDNEGIQVDLSIASQVITLEMGIEPTNDGDTDNNTNLTVDFGFYACQKGARIAWDNTIGGTGAEHIESIIETPDGGLLVGGPSNSGISGDKTEAVWGSYDYWVVKLDANGEIEWQNDLGGTGQDWLYAMCLDPAGGYVIAGGSGSGISGDKTMSDHNGYDTWVFKLDETGQNIIWQNELGADGSESPKSISNTADGGYLVACNADSDINGDKTENSKGYSDYWVIKLDMNGVIAWDKTIGGDSTDYVRDAIETSDGGFIVGGNTRSGIGGDKTEVFLGGLYDWWVVKLDAAGNVEWDKTLGGTGIDELETVRQTADGGYLVSGIKEYDPWVVKLDANGNILWDKVVNGISTDLNVHLQLTPDGGFAIGVSSLSGIGGDKTEASNGAYDFWIIKFDADGNIEWDKTAGGNLNDSFYSFAALSDGSFAAAGNSLSGISGDKTEANIGSNDFWVTKVLEPINNNCTDMGNFELGDLVWLDDDIDATKDAAEKGIAGVEVDLYVDNGDGIYNSSDDVYLFRTKTSTDGSYLFDNLSTGNYFVRISPDNYLGNSVLSNMENSPGLFTLNNEDHGINTLQAGQFGVLSEIILLTANDTTIDFGFYNPPAIMTIGNLVFEDINNNSFREITEPGIPNVTVELYRDMDGDEMFSPKDTLVDTQITDPSGLYSFTNLSPGKYIINIPASNWAGALNGMLNSTAFGGNDFDNDNDDAGVEEMHYDEANQGVASSVLTLEYEGEPDVAIDGDGINGNLTVDFGFYNAVNLGNLVWDDTNKDGIKDTGELGIEHVRLDLFQDTDGDGLFNKDKDAFYWTTFTDANGNYNFDRLGEDNYFVRISPRNFQKGGVLQDLMTPTYSVSGNSDINEHNHGSDYDFYQIEGVKSSIVNLTFGGEPNTIIDSDDMNGNLTIDFGFTTSNICGKAWHDLDEDGIFNNADTLLTDVTVQLIDNSTGRVIDMRLTAGDGTYSMAVPTGDYVIQFDETSNIGGIEFGSPTSKDISGPTLTDLNDSDISMVSRKTIVHAFVTGNTDCDIDAGFRISVLPVELSHFTVSQKDCNAVLNWLTLSEENNSHFVIEKSTDGNTFREIATITGQGTSSIAHSYLYEDKRLKSEKNYYRLKQIDFDGTYSYSEVVLLKIKEDSYCLNPLGAAIIFPNPTTDIIRFEINLDETIGQTEFTITNLLGQELWKEKILLSAGSNSHGFDLSIYPPGIYYLTTNSGNNQINSFKIILVDKE